MNTSTVIFVLGTLAFLPVFMEAFILQPAVLVMPGSTITNRAATVKQRASLEQLHKRAYWNPQGRFGKRAPVSGDVSGSNVDRSDAIKQMEDSSMPLDFLAEGKRCCFFSWGVGVGI